jgi:DNA-binding transcriptional LysR family regulator
VRPAISLPDHLTGHQIGQMSFAVYHKVGVNQPSGWLGLAGALSNSLPAQWMVERVDPFDIVSSADSFCALAQIAAAGSCRVVLPCVLGDSHSDLQRDLAGPTIDCIVPIWVACHRDLAASHRINRCMDALSKLIKPHAIALAGKT